MTTLENVAGPKAPNRGPASTVATPSVEPRFTLPAAGPATTSSGRGVHGEGSPRPDDIDHEIRLRAMVETAFLWKHDHITTEEFYLLLEAVVK